MRQSNQTPESTEARLQRYADQLRKFHDPREYPTGQIVGVLGEAIMRYMYEEYKAGQPFPNRMEELILYFDNIQRLLLFVEHEFHDTVPTRTSYYTEQVTGRPDESYDLNAQ
jgi:hypothetical protein